MISLARSEPGIAITPDVLDLDPFLLNCQNVTVDLRTGQPRPHRRDDLVTKVTACDFDPNAKCPQWLAFLDRVLDGNSKVIEFVRRFFGYALTGTVSEQILVFLLGGGSNGKSTLIEALLSVMGDYGKMTAPGLLVLKRNEQHPTELADLRGARLAASVEVEQGKQLAESLIKALTGGDTMKARWMHGDFFEWQPTHKLALAANHKPVIKGTDLAIWRRIRLIEFNVTIPEAEQDTHLSDKLRAEASGILAWLVEGCLSWQKDGIGAPPEVIEATAAYRAAEDVLAEWIADECVLGETAKATAADLYASYQEWSKAAGERPMSKRALALALAERGLVKGRDRNTGRWWAGIGLTAQPGLESGAN